MLKRRLEPEVMDSDRDAREYNSMNHREVNRVFVQDLLDFARSNWLAIGAIGSAKLEEEDDAREDDKFPLGDVLDVGTGTAQIPIELCKRHRHCRIMAIDLAVSMLNLAVYNVEVAGVRERVQLAQIDAKNMVFRDNMFDVVISNSIVHHLPEPAASIQEMIRVVRPEGLIFVRDLMRPAFQSTLNQIVADYAGNESDYSKQLFADSLHAALSLEEMRELVSRFGFSIEQVQATSDRHWTWAARRDGHE